MQLRDYQSECSDAIVKDLETYDRVSAVLPTGSGKSLIEIDIIDRLMVDTPFDHCILFLCHIKDLAVQLYESYQAHGKSPKAAFMYVGTRKPFFSSKILFSTMQSACSDKRRLNKPLGKRVTHIVIDEAHFFGVKSYEKICDEFYPDAKVIGFSATPFRQNQFSFSMFDRVSFAIDIKTLIDRGFLVPPSLIQMAFPDDNFSTRMASIVKIWKEKEKPRKMVSIVYFPTVEQALEARNVFSGVGARTEFVDAKTVERDSARIYNAARLGKVDVIVNVNKISTGIDIPGIAAIFMPYPTKSVTQYLQRIGRALRPFKDKKEANIYVFSSAPSIKRGDWQHIHDFALDVEKDPTTPGEDLASELDFLELDPKSNSDRIAWTMAAMAAVNLLESNGLPDISRLVAYKQFPQKYSRVVAEIIKQIQSPKEKSGENLSLLQRKMLTEKFKFKPHHIKDVNKAEASELISGLMKYHQRSPFIIPAGPMAGKHCSEVPGLYKKNVKDPVARRILRSWYQAGRPGNEV